MSICLTTNVEAEIDVKLVCAECKKEMIGSNCGRDDTITVEHCKNCGNGKDPITATQSFPEFLTDRIRRGIFSLECPDKNSLIRFIDEQCLIFKSL